MVRYFVPLVLIVAFCPMVLADTAPRQSVDLNPGWKFIRQDVPGAEATAFDDSTWQSISLPHTWNVEDGETAHYYRGVGWYRRHLDLSGQNVSGKSLFLRFDGASIDTQVYVNGQSAGTPHKGMFGAFCYDVTSLLNPAGDNVIAARVDNSRDETVPPLTADFTFFGGIYRSVHLLVLNPLSVTPLDDASPGVYLKQTNVTADRAEVEITTKVRNAAAAEPATVACDVLDATGAVVQQATLQATVASGSTSDFVEKIAIDHPHLWNARKDPYLYHVRVTVSDATGVTDQVIQPLGLRFFRVDPDQGFFLNGQSYPLHGVNRHQDRQGMGWAISPKEHEEDFDLIMEMGCTAIRLAHYEHAQEFYDLCDKGGLVVWAEDGVVNTVGYAPEFTENAERIVRELIKQDYNHPSICFWSLFNELGNPKRVTAEEREKQNEYQIALITDLNNLAHQIDPTRLTTAATLLAPTAQLNQITDVIAFNHYLGWYNGTRADWPSWLDGLRSALPGRDIGVSEYGAGASIFEHELDPAQPKTTSTWHPEEWQCLVHESAWAAMKQRPWLWGTFLWNMFDFASGARREGDHFGINDKGLVTYDRKTKKDAFYFYKANWSDDPFVHINDRRFSPRNVGTGPVKIYSNCDSVELRANGNSLGSKTADDHIFIWPDVSLNQGDNELYAV
ncbi:MAG TPA: glycoside hydrolase family 2 TIM barrel-domain containing protein, partial [Tepidisphaeraceae bacterium]|nr:glycoside hydrolase family 2 TIM barrel-domain containing protein [Tepidisphaeraceae bacterium]